MQWKSYSEAGEGYVLTTSGIQEMVEKYVLDPGLREHPYVSPLLADDLSGLPPAFIVTAVFDTLRDEGEAYAKRLMEAGVPVISHRKPGLHGFMGSPDHAKSPVGCC